MIYVGVGIVVVFILILVVFPLLVYLFLKHPANPPFEEWTLESFPHEVQEYFFQVIPVLEDEGFDLICYCGQTTPGPEYFILLKHRNKQDIATVTSGPPCDAKQSWRRFIEFTTKMNNVVMQTNNNRHQPVLDLQPVDIKRYNFPTIYDLHELYLLHRALVRHHAGNAAPRLWEDGKELAQFKHVFIKKLEGEAEYGFMYVDLASNAYRPTLKGAFLTGLFAPLELLLLWPFGGIRRWLVNRRTNRILEEIAETRKHVEQEDVDTRRFSGEQRRIRQEQREQEQRAAFLKPESENAPILIEEQRGSGLLVDIEEKFRDGPVKQAAGLPNWAVCFIFLPVAAILTLVAIVALFKTGNQFFETKRLEYFGASTQATVLDRRIETIEKDNDGATYFVYRYYVTYRFQAVMCDARRQTSAREEQVTEQYYHRLAVGDDVPIVYDQKNPRISHIKGNYVIFSFSDHEALPLWSFHGLMTLFFLFAGTLIAGFYVIKLFLWIVHDIIALWFLFTRGQVTTASIVTLDKHGDSDAFQDSTEYVILYRFQTSHPSGESTTITGRQKIPGHVYDAYRTQKTVNVRYVPTKPEWFKLDL